jgi:imidazolonepropionase-like amidohydrolase
MIDAGLPLALAQILILVLHIRKHEFCCSNGLYKMKMTPEEAINAAINGAYAMGLSHPR